MARQVIKRLPQVEKLLHSVTQESRTITWEETLNSQWKQFNHQTHYTPFITLQTWSEQWNSRVFSSLIAIVKWGFSGIAITENKISFRGRDALNSNPEIV